MSDRDGAVRPGQNAQLQTKTHDKPYFLLQLGLYSSRGKHHTQAAVVSIRERKQSHDEHHNIAVERRNSCKRAILRGSGREQEERNEALAIISNAEISSCQLRTCAGAGSHGQGKAYQANKGNDP